MRRLPALLCLLFAATQAWGDATEPTADIEGARDPAWLQRYEGSFIVSHEQRGFDAVSFPASVLKRVPGQTDAYNNNVFRAEQQREVEGEYVRLLYVAPADRSPLEVMRNYLDLVEEGGGQVLWRCRDTDCGGDLNGNDHGGGNQGLIEQLYPQARRKDANFSNGWCTSGSTPREQHYSLATLPDGSGGERTLGIVTFQIGDRTYCDALHDRTAVLVVAVSPKARERKMVTVSSDDMAKALDADGRIALYGIQFDTNKSSLKPESVETIAQIAKLLQAQPVLKLDVVGHTDNVGEAAANLRLSQRRADAVVASLVEDHGIDEARLTSRGEGLGKPIADNATEDGRAKNRRVELVKR
ncbi:OmpA family protein [Arenimonas sp.]|uniref:OmpA family protein n=1 Tax=Arenimonas sp. TaxID=1872635 RepID=UPI002E35B795|nr:OmpA family protein [Arenimonas sp.]HEX4854825.1 OmpA family protein [Arenimonas sp.]